MKTEAKEIPFFLSGENSHGKNHHLTNYYHVSVESVIRAIT